MSRVTVVIEVDVPAEFTGAQLNNIVVKAFDRTTTKGVRVITTKFYHTDQFDAHMSGRKVAGRAVRKTVQVKGDQVDGSS